jgi:hypothetical protein
MCQKHGIVVTSGFEEGEDIPTHMKKVMLVPDSTTKEKAATLQEKNKQVTLVSCNWFYLSIMFRYELPLEPFTQFET